MTCLKPSKIAVLDFSWLVDNIDGKLSCNIRRNALSIVVILIFNNFSIKLNISAVYTINCTDWTQCTKDINYPKNSLTIYLTVFICTLLYLLCISITLLLWYGDIEVNPGQFEHSIISDDSVDSILTSLDLRYPTHIRLNFSNP